MNIEYGFGKEPTLLFWKRRSPGGKPSSSASIISDSGHEKVYLIDYDMMLKGSIAHRGRKPVRQIGVSVNGTTRVVTSGEFVDRETYEALIESGAIRPLEAAATNPPEAPPQQPRPAAHHGRENG